MLKFLINKFEVDVTQGSGFIILYSLVCYCID